MIDYLRSCCRICCWFCALGVKCDDIQVTIFNECRFSITRLRLLQRTLSHSFVPSALNVIVMSCLSQLVTSRFSTRIGVQSNGAQCVRGIAFISLYQIQLHCANIPYCHDHRKHVLQAFTVVHGDCGQPCWPLSPVRR